MYNSRAEGADPFSRTINPAQGARTHPGAKFKRKTMHDHIANTLIVTGAVLVALGAGMVFAPAGVVTFGVFCIGGGVILAMGNVRR